jgi:hypothetical protein
MRSGVTLRWTHDLTDMLLIARLMTYGREHELLVRCRRKSYPGNHTQLVRLSYRLTTVRTTWIPSFDFKQLSAPTARSSRNVNFILTLCWTLLKLQLHPYSVLNPLEKTTYEFSVKYFFFFLFLGNNDRAICISRCKRNRTSSLQRVKPPFLLIASVCLSLQLKHKAPTCLRVYPSSPTASKISCITWHR